MNGLKWNNFVLPALNERDDDDTMKKVYKLFYFANI